MGDIADRAGEAIEACQADAEARARGKSAPEHDPEFDGVHCVDEDCGVEIPAARLALGKIRCVDCQAVLEVLGYHKQRLVKVWD